MTIELIQVETKLIRRADETKTVTVTGESTSSPYFAITPSIRHDDDGVHFGWGKSVTHIPSGLTLPTGEADHRMVVDAVADLIDWSSATPLADPVDRKLVIGVVRKLIDDAYEANPWPEWAGDATKPALSLLVTQLDDGIENYDKRRDDRNELVGKVAAFDAALARKIGGYLDAGRIGIHVQTYGTAWLLAVLMQLDPDVADQAARGLVSAWEDGGAPDEHFYEWRNAIANGRPPRLYGITFQSPSLDLGDVK